MSNSDFLEAADPKGTAERRRIFCDCSGTLYNARGQAGINDLVVRYLIAAHKLGYEVILFSSDPGGSKMVISLESMDDKRLEEAPFNSVRKKSDFDGQEALAVIDDEQTSHGLNARFQYTPDDERILKTLEHWQSQEMGDKPEDLRA